MVEQATTEMIEQKNEEREIRKKQMRLRYNSEL